VEDVEGRPPNRRSVRPVGLPSIAGDCSRWIVRYSSNGLIRDRSGPITETHRYSLVCLDCLVGLHLGKFVTLDEQSNPVSPQFTGYRDTDHERWVGQPGRGRDTSPDLWDAVQWFLFGHRTHDLAVSDSGLVLEMYEDFDPSFKPFSYIQDVDELLAHHDNLVPGAATERLRRRIDARASERGMKRQTP
jgi:hypothetical protein